MPRLVLLGVGAMNSPRYRPAGLLVTWGGPDGRDTAHALGLLAHMLDSG